MTDFKITDKNGIKLKTANKYVTEDLAVTLTNGDINNIVAENIKEGVAILGITGTFDGGGDTTQEDGLVTGEISGDYSNDRITKVRNYAFSNCQILTSANLPQATSIGNYAFRDCSYLTDISLPQATSIGYSAFYNCSKLTSISLPQATSIGYSAFSNCYLLIKLVITKTDSVCTLSNTNAFQNCYHFLGTKNITYNPTGAKDGYIYVPDALVSSYKTTTNWSTYASQIKSLSNLYTWVAANQSFDASMNVGFNVNGQTYFGTTQTYSIDLGPGAKNISLSSNTNTAFVSNLADYSYNSTTGILTVNKLYNQYPTTATITVKYDKRKLDI